MKIGMRRVLRGWVWRGAWGMGVVALLLVVRLVWGWEAGRRLEGVKAELRAKGVRFEQSTEVIADEENPYALLTKALDLMEPFSLTDSALIDGDGSVLQSERIWTAEEKTKIQAVLSRHQATFRMVDSARGKIRTISSAIYDTSNLGKTRGLANLLLVSAILSHEDGREIDALRDLQRCMSVALILDQRGNLISHLVALAIRREAAATIERVEPTLQFNESDGTLANGQALLQACEEKSLASFGVSNYESEIGTSEIAAREYYKLNGWWIRPLRDDDVARVMRLNASQLEGVRAADWATAEKFFSTVKFPVSVDTNLNRLAYWCSREFNDYVITYMRLHFRGEADRSAAAILIASRLYSAQHHRLPTSIAEMVPDYLPVNLIDPFSPLHLPMRYRLDPAGPTIWSVGEDLKDDGGAVRLTSGDKGRRYHLIGGTVFQFDIIYGAAWRTAGVAATATPGATGTGIVPAPKE